MCGDSPWPCLNYAQRSLSYVNSPTVASEYLGSHERGDLLQEGHFTLCFDTHNAKCSGLNNEGVALSRGGSHEGGATVAYFQCCLCFISFREGMHAFTNGQL